MYTSAERKTTMIKARKTETVQADVNSVRATISFPPDMYRTLEEIARQKKVSLAWVVREAVEQYFTDKWPLFGKSVSGDKS
jgi:predicted DNA-binding ribbon-helix-helix protein